MLKKKYRIFLLIILVTSVFSITLFSNSLIIDSTLENVNDTPIDLYNLRGSGPQINITTPENKTYYEPMSEFYPATYGFENDDIGKVPMNWEDNSEVGCSIYTDSEKNTHKKVLHLDDDSGNKVYAKNSFTNQSYGTVEMWILMEDSTWGIGIRLADNKSGEQVFKLLINGDKWKYHDGADQQIISAFDGVYDPVDNTWYHIRIHFRCNGAPSYQGLNENKFKVIIDGYESEELSAMTVKNHIGKLVFATDAANSDDTWVDAIGYSWDTNYIVGDNLNEGLLLSFNLGFNPDWIGYSLDGLANKTILGNTTIPLPAEGLHSAQVFGNDTLGTMYQSDVRYFTIDHHLISIFTPKNKTYYEPMGEYYPATYGFENDDIGNVPLNWEDNSEAGCSIYVVSEKGNHKKVLLLDDDSANKVYGGNYFSNQSYGTVEMWVLMEDCTDAIGIRLTESKSGENLFRFLINQDKWKYHDGVDQQIISAFDGVYDPVDNTWYHIKIHFRCNGAPSYQGLNENKFRVVIDGLESEELDARIANNAVNKLTFTTTAATTVDAWVDAVGYSWDQNYNIGDNLDEGLLLSFENHTNLDWIGYSLDGLANKTILGNITFSFPTNEGLHSIQVFGNDTFGTMYESDVRYFTTLYYPEVSITSPNHHEFFGNTAPGFVLSIIESNLHSSWYTLDDGITNITFSGFTGQINQTEWDKSGNGTVSIRFYANDTWGLEGYDEVTIWKDTYSPASSILFVPHTGIDVVNETTEFSLTADDGLGSGVSFIRYKINDSSWITYSSPFTLVNYPYGDILITYQAVDQVDNYETEQQLVVDRTDTISPTSSILYTPYEVPNIVIQSTVFTITATDEPFGSGLSLIRYKINDSGWITYTGQFDLTGYDYAAYIITYQAIDLAGNIETENSINIILAPASIPPGIPGYQLFIMIGVISIVSAILVKKKFK